MCLLTFQKKPFIAQEDIPVIKYLDYDSNNEIYYTPYLREVIHLNNLYKGNYNIPPRISPYLTEVRDGFIHSITKNMQIQYFYNYNLVKCLAYIPKGTEFFINAEMDEVASRKLFITDKDAEEADYGHSLKMIFKSIFRQLIPSNNISFGWLYLKNGRYIHPSDYNSSLEDIEGVVYKKELHKTVLLDILNSSNGNFIDFEENAYKDLITSDEVKDEKFISLLTYLIYFFGKEYEFFRLWFNFNQENYFSIGAINLSTRSISTEDLKSTILKKKVIEI